MRYCVMVVLFVSALYTSAQTCIISSKSTVCKLEVVNFSGSFNSGTMSSCHWDFGDNSSGNQQNIGHSYSETGNKTVTFTVYFTDGSSCQVSKDIYVHDIPTASFSLDASDFCQSQQKICLEDLSDMGETTNGYNSRIILWGDGASTQDFSPSVGDDICYSDYGGIGKYDITVEVQNDKGCESKWEAEIDILKDYEVSYTLQPLAPGCTSQKFCFINDSVDMSSEIVSFSWDFGDGTTDNMNWEQACHTYTANGNYYVRLTVHLQNGCVNVMEKYIEIKFPEIKIDVQIGDTVVCYPNSVFLSHALISGGFYSWQLFDTNKVLVQNVSSGLSASVFPPEPGDYYVRLIIQRGTCAGHSRFIKITSLGVKANFKALNDRQCLPEDTVYFHNRSVSHRTAKPKYLWYFDDDSAAACTSSVSHCNFDTLFHAAHFYPDTGCYDPVLYAYDPVSGCRDTAYGVVNILYPSVTDFAYQLDSPCIGRRPEYTVRFSHRLCNVEVRAQYDSCDIWYDFVATRNYDSVCNAEGWVSVKFAVTTGDSIVYRSADPYDFYIDERKICLDTFYFRHWFQLHPDPEAEFEFSRETCLPNDVVLIYTGEDPYELRWLEYNWGDNSESGSFVMNKEAVSNLQHTYTEEGQYLMSLMVRDTFGCFAFYTHQEQFGYFNDFKVDSIICSGREVQFIDSVYYWGDLQPYWRNAANPEKISWDLGLGEGFSVQGPQPRIIYPDTGVYQVRMATVDRHGCEDTLNKNVFVGSVNAIIRHNNGQYLCDQIAQFFDSSYSDFKNKGDSVIYHYWDFGDFTRESYLKDPYHYYRNNGNYILTHAVESEAGCRDTAELLISLQGPEPEFDILSDSVGCVPFTATFRSNSQRVSEWIWHFGDPANNTLYLVNDSTVSFTYNEPGIYYVYLEGLDSFYNEASSNYYSCRSVFPDTTISLPILKRIIVLPIPEVDFITDQPLCVGSTVQFINQSDSIYDQFLWKINGLEHPENIDRIYHTLEDTGLLQVGLYPRYTPNGIYERACFDSSVKDMQVSHIEAKFIYKALDNCAKYHFHDSSLNADTYHWDFGQPSSGSNNQSDLKDPLHEYGNDSSWFSICLSVSNAAGCEDSACANLKGNRLPEAQFYNVYTPGIDGINDDFGVDIEGHSFFELNIFNRWGEKVFSTNNPEVKWNGQLFNSGMVLPAAIYFYICRYRMECDGKEETVQGQVQMIR